MATRQTETADRARTALDRVSLSRPIRIAIDDGLLEDRKTVFDYGCGRGGDLKRLRKAGIRCAGWDPHHRPRGLIVEGDVVNLGYVINVIEDPEERRQTMLAAWGLARRVLIVSARLRGETRGLEGEHFGDGLRTSLGTFQKLFTQGELKDWIEATLRTKAVAGAPGVFFVFRNVADEQVWLLRRVSRSRKSAPISRERLDRHADLLEPLVQFVTDRGRLPKDEELGDRKAIEDEFGTLRNAFALVRRVTGDDRWDRIRDSRSRDLLVFLALARFDGRPRPKDLPAATRYDIRDLFGSYASACRQADRLLAELSSQDRIREAAASSPTGKHLPAALYLHADGIDSLPPILRLMDGVARRLIGTLDGATVVKIHLDRPAVSYLQYPNFDTDAHPALNSGYIVVLDQLRCDFRDYSRYPSPPVLHRKELLLPSDDPRRPRFEALTRQEERAGLFGRTNDIGSRAKWETLLVARGYKIAGHRLRRI